MPSRYVKMDSRSSAAGVYRSWYWTSAWRAISRAQLAKHPICAKCIGQGRTTTATICDHVEPHRGNATKFWKGPFQSLCKGCHDVVKQGEERRGYKVGSDVSGRPIDPTHPWNLDHKG